MSSKNNPTNAGATAASGKTMMVTEYWVNSSGFALMLLESPGIKENPRSVVGSPVYEDESDPDSRKIGLVADIDSAQGRLKIQLDEPMPIPRLLNYGVSFDDLILDGSTSNPD